MFAYCNSNPVNFHDDAGTRMEYVSFDCGAPVAFPCPSAVSQSTISGGNSGSFTREAKDFINNTDEQAVLKAKYFSFYRGVPVVKLPIGTDAFSFGIIFLGSDVGKRADALETVRHEYGHALHYRMAGALSYTVTAFIPSVVGYYFGDEEYQANYYSQVYEYTADILGNVDRPNYEYSTTTENWFGAYFLFTTLFI